MMTEDAWQDFGLQRLFNPNNLEFLPIEEQLKLYKKRDLAKTKAIRTEWKIWGEPRNRKRIIVAPPMEKVPPPVRAHGVTTHSSSETRSRDQGTRPSRETESPPLKVKTPDTISQINQQPIGEKYKRQLEQRKMDQKRVVYSPWLQNRKGFRANFEQLDDCSFRWVSRKPNKSPVERKYYQQQLAMRRNLDDTENEQSEMKFVDVYDTDVPIPPEDILSEMSFDSSLYAQSDVTEVSRPNTVGFKMPKIVQPSAKAMALIADYIHRQRIRLIELFMRVDKNKDWKVNKSQFRQCMAEARIQLSDQEVDDLMMTLDTDENEELDYRHFVYGMNRYKEEQKDLSASSEFEDSYSREWSSEKQRVGSSRGVSRESSALLPSMSGSRASSRVQSATDQRQGSASSVKSRNATTPPTVVVVDHDDEDQENSNLLRVPSTDLSEQIEMDPDDLIIKKKREKVFNRLSGKSLDRKMAAKSAEPKRIYTGESKLDNFSTQSSMSGGMGGVANRYKENHVKEFRQVLVRCKQRNVTVDERTLENGLLFPNDTPIMEATKKIRQPGRLLSNQCGVHFARHCRQLASSQQKATKKKQ